MTWSSTIIFSSKATVIKGIQMKANSRVGRGDSGAYKLSSTGNEKALLWDRGKNNLFIYNVESDSSEKLVDFWFANSTKLEPLMAIANQSCTKVVGLGQNSADIAECEFLVFMEAGRKSTTSSHKYFELIETWECLESSTLGNLFYAGGEHRDQGVIVAIGLDFRLEVDSWTVIRSPTFRSVTALKRIIGSEYLAAGGPDGVRFFLHRGKVFEPIAAISVPEATGIEHIRMGGHTLYMVDESKAVFCRWTSEALEDKLLLMQEHMASNIGAYSDSVKTKAVSLAKSAKEVIGRKMTEVTPCDEDPEDMTEGLGNCRLDSQTLEEIHAVLMSSTILSLSQIESQPKAILESMLADEELFLNNLKLIKISRVDLPKQIDHGLFTSSSDQDILVSTDQGIMDLVLDRTLGYQPGSMRGGELLQAMTEIDSSIYLQVLTNHSLQVYSKVGQRVMKTFEGNSVPTAGLKLSPNFRVKQSPEIQDIVIWYAGGTEMRLVNLETMEQTSVANLIGVGAADNTELHSIISITKPRKILALTSTESGKKQVTSYDIAKKKERIFVANTVSDEKKVKSAEGML
jgi:hypothetical protein